MFRQKSSHGMNKKKNYKKPAWMNVKNPASPWHRSKRGKFPQKHRNSTLITTNMKNDLSQMEGRWRRKRFLHTKKYLKKFPPRFPSLFNIFHLQRRVVWEICIPFQFHLLSFMLLWQKIATRVIYSNKLITLSSFWPQKSSSCSFFTVFSYWILTHTHTH